MDVNITFMQSLVVSLAVVLLPCLLTSASIFAEFQNRLQLCFASEISGKVRLTVCMRFIGQYAFSFRSGVFYRP